MSDLRYILTHPLCARIIRHCKELEEQARALPEGSKERKALERRIGKLQEYGLPRPTAGEQEETELIVDRAGRKIGERHSVRRRYIGVRRGRPAQWRVKVRAALEEKLSTPELRWSELADALGFKPRWRYYQDRSRKRIPAKADLETQVYTLKKLLQQEGIGLPTAADIHRAEQDFYKGLADLDARQRLDPFQSIL